MTVDDVVAFYGTQTKAAKALGLTSHAALSYWRKQGIPYARQCQIEVDTDGKLKADKPAEPEKEGAAA